MAWKKRQHAAEKFGEQDIKPVLVRLYAQYGNHEDVAHELDTTVRTVRRWCKDAGCEFELRVKCCDSAIPAAPQSQEAR